METGETPKVFDRNLCPISCCLKSILLSGSMIRYMNVSKLMYADLSSNLDMKTCGFPLFLGKDVFASCNLTQNNVQRIHARYSKEGLATKVTFDDFRIDGMTQNKVWFYNIQGLFQVIFYYFKKDVQKDCLKILTDIWLQHSDDPVLSEAMSVRLDEESARINLTSLGPVWRDIELVNKHPSDGNKHCTPNTHCTSNTHLNHKFSSQHSSENTEGPQKHLKHLNSKIVQDLQHRNDDSNDLHCSRAHSSSQIIHISSKHLNKRKHTSIQAEEIYLNMSTKTEEIYSNMSTQTEKINSNMSTQTEEIYFNMSTKHGNIYSNMSTQTEMIYSNMSTQTEEIYLNMSIQTEKINSNMSTQSEDICFNMSTEHGNIYSNMSTQNEEIYSNISTVEMYTDNLRQTNDTIVQTDGISVILENDNNYNTEEENVSKHPHVITNISEQKTRMEMKKTKKHCEQTHELVNGHYQGLKIQTENKPTIMRCPYCVYLIQEKTRLHPDLTNCLIKLNQFLLFMYSETDEDFLTLFCDVICLFLDHYPNIILPVTFSSELLEEFRGCDSDISKNEIHDNFLNFICKYVGKELNQFDSQISENVEKFKENHIKCIDNLPPPEEIIDDIFPLCMKELIVHWMNPQIQTCVNISEQKRFKSSPDILPDFHIIQLILEFVNNSLISGVAHVVYSRIRSIKNATFQGKEAPPLRKLCPEYLSGLIPICDNDCFSLDKNLLYVKGVNLPCETYINAEDKGPAFGVSLKQSRRAWAGQRGEPGILGKGISRSRSLF
ncbi:unnamed protein product [Mytilus coruscus]|uniref:Uncharacterized protein n=1 Tax=Mytilus coruscus TaxID=42192 RepID=A0A6J8EJQ0_MYTCO|nr:unnamed protein product [Mytilus coruscus]